MSVATTVVRSEPVSADTAPIRDRGRSSKVIGRVLITVSLVVAWVVLYLTVLSQFDEAHSQKALYAQLRSELAQGIAPVQQPISVGAPVAVLSIASAGVKKQVVVEGTSAAELQRGPGHLRNSVLPGQPGVSVIAGRSLTFGKPFDRLKQLKAGDPISVTTGQGDFTFNVRDLRHAGDLVPPLQAGASRLILVTALSSAGTGALQPNDTLFVDADLSGTPAPAAPANTLTIGSQELPLQSDTSALTLAELVLAMQLLLAAVVGTFWLRSRWDGALVWLGGAPAILAALWLTSHVASRLLPNLM